MKDGVLVVQDALAENVVRIFEKLKERKFSIAPIKLLSGKKLVNRLPFGLFGLKKAVNDDDVNNLTGAYHCRKIQHKDKNTPGNGGPISPAFSGVPDFIVLQKVGSQFFTA